MKKLLTLIAGLLILSNAHAADWTVNGNRFERDGVPRIFLGIYYIDPPNDQAVIDAINDIASIGLDAIFVYVDDGDSAILSAANSAGIEVVPDWGEYANLATYEGYWDSIGPFDMVITADDLDGGTSCATHTTQQADYATAFNNVPIQYGSMGNLLATTSDYFDCGFDTLGWQAYPVGDGNYNEEPSEVNVYHWNRFASYTGPFVANAQLFAWPSERQPYASEVFHMSRWALDNNAAGIVWYTYYDSGNADLDTRTEQYQALQKVVENIRACESFYLTRLIGE